MPLSSRVSPILLTALVLCTVPAAAQEVHHEPPERPRPQRAEDAAAPPGLDARTRAAVVDSLAAQLLRAYVDADTARLIADAVRTRLRAGAYDTITTPAVFAEHVSRDLRSVNGDLHLSLRYRYMVAPGAPSGPAAPAPGPRGPSPEQAARENFGLTRLEILPGNVGYLEISSFLYPRGYEDAVATALRFLERADAVIVDLRRNRGGGEMSHYVQSHFLPAEPVTLVRAASRYSGETIEIRSLAEVKGPRRTDVPLYVLTGPATGSAAEGFAFALKNLGRATLVGEGTAGAGNMVLPFEVGHGFTAFISHARVVDPRTGQGWERVGVQPNRRVPVERALDAAHAAALRAVAERSSDAARQETLARIAATMEARARGALPQPADLRALPGSFEGGRSIEARDGRLWYSPRAGTLPAEMVPLGEGRFGLPDGTRLSLDRSGGTPRLVVESPDGERLSYARTE